MIDWVEKHSKLLKLVTILTGIWCGVVVYFSARIEGPINVKPLELALLALPFFIFTMAYLPIAYYSWFAKERTGIFWKFFKGFFYFFIIMVFVMWGVFWWSFVIQPIIDF